MQTTCASCRNDHKSIRMYSTWLCQIPVPTCKTAVAGGVPQDGTAANGHGPPDGTSNGHAQSYDSESDGSELLAPLSPEPELDKFDHEQPVDAGPVGSHEQVRQGMCLDCRQPTGP